MMATAHIETADDLIAVIGRLWENKSLRALKEFILDIPSEDEVYRLIRLADEADLYGYSNLLATRSYKRFGTLRSYAWHCTRLAETGRSLEAEEKMLARLQGIHAHSYQDEELMHAHHLLLKVYCQLNRLKEAEEQLARIEQLGGARPDQQAYFLIHSGDWAAAQRVLEKAIDVTDTRWSPIIHILYADLLSMRGDIERSLELIDKGQARFPAVHSFRMERVARLYQLGRYAECLVQMDFVSAHNPYHVRRLNFVHIAAHCLYELERFDELASWIAAHADQLKDTLYAKAEIDAAGQHRKLALTPEVQKLNYCVPASLSLMLQAFEKKASQDDIAAHIFDVTGTKLHTTMKYMESLGFTARYFKGTIERYKQLIDGGIPVLLSMFIENSAHVQVVVGYDDRLQALIIQDPNDLAPFLIAYTEVPKLYRLSDSLSMVFTEPAHNGLLVKLDEQEHRFFTEFYEYMDEEPIQEQPFTRFLAQHESERYAAVVGLTMGLGEQALQEKWLAALQAELGQDDEELALLFAHVHFQKEQWNEALEQLGRIHKSKSPYALFLQAAISINQGHTERAIPLLKRSIELDHFQPAAYSYLARCYLENGKIYQAYKWSNIAIHQLPEDVFAQVTHGLIQYEYGAVEQAYRRFEQLAEKYPDDGYFSYEMGRCEQALGKTDEALATYRRSLELDRGLPFPYLRMAELYMEQERWGEAQAVIEEGLGQDDTQDILHLYLGHIAIEQEDFKRAENSYQRALQLDPADLFTPTHIAHALFGQQRSGEAIDWLHRYAAQADAGYRLRAADLLWDQVPGVDGKLQALSFIEQGFEGAELEELRMLAERYSELGTDAAVLHRVIAGFKALRKMRDPQLLCLEGELHELAGNPRFAKRLYKEAGDFPAALQKRGLLCEMAEDYQCAITHYEQAAEQEAGFASALGGLVRCYRELEQPANAFAAALNYLAAEPLSAVLPELADFAETDSDVQKLNGALTRIEDQVPAEWFYAARAHVAEAQGDFAGAEGFFKQAVEEPGAFPSRFQYAQFLQRVGQTKRAADMIEQLIAEAPEEADLYNEYASAMETLGKVPLMKRRLKKTLPAELLGTAYVHAAEAVALRLEELESEQVSGWIDRLRLHSKRILFASTVISLCEMAAKISASEEPSVKLAQFYISRDMAKEASAELKPFAEMPGEAQRLLIFTTLQQGQQSGKPKDFTEVVERAAAYPAEQLDAEVLMWWSEALHVLGDKQQALQKLEQAIALEPFNPELYTQKWHVLADVDPEELESFEATLPEALLDAEGLIVARASTYSTQGHGQRAKELLMPVLADIPEFVPARFELARAEVVRNNPQAAKKILQELLKTEEGAATWEAVEREPLFETIILEITSS